VGEASCVGLPGVGEQVEAFMQAELGMGVELGGALLGGGTGSSLLALVAPSGSLGSATGSIAVVHVAYDGGEVAVADAHLAATGVPRIKGRSRQQLSGGTIRDAA